MARVQPRTAQPRRAIVDPEAPATKAAPRRTGTHLIRAGIAMTAVCAVGVIGIVTPGLAQGASATSASSSATLGDPGTASAFAARGEAASRGASRPALDDADTAAAAQARAVTLFETDEQLTEAQQETALALRAAGLSDSTKRIAKESERLERLRFAWPTAGGITSPWGPRLHPILRYVRMHGGVDIGGTCGQPIRAVQDGVVTQESSGSQSGKFLRIDHGDLSGTKVETAYLHMASFSVGKGDRVERGQVIGRVGNTGLSTACHLHFALYEDGTNTDPEKRLNVR